MLCSGARLSEGIRGASAILGSRPSDPDARSVGPTNHSPLDVDTEAPDFIGRGQGGCSEVLD